MEIIVTFSSGQNVHTHSDSDMCCVVCVLSEIYVLTRQEPGDTLHVSLDHLYFHILLLYKYFKQSNTDSQTTIRKLPNLVKLLGRYTLAILLFFIFLMTLAKLVTSITNAKLIKTFSMVRASRAIFWMTCFGYCCVSLNFKVTIGILPLKLF